MLGAKHCWLDQVKKAHSPRTQVLSELGTGHCTGVGGSVPEPPRHPGSKSNSYRPPVISPSRRQATSGPSMTPSPIQSPPLSPLLPHPHPNNFSLLHSGLDAREDLPRGNALLW